MTKDDILKMIEECFDDNIYIINHGGDESSLEGKRDFLNELKRRLDKFFDENDLPK